MNCCDNVNRMEFVITYDCTGRCKHCSEGDHVHTGVHLDGEAAANSLYNLMKSYSLTSVMTFGGEPLMYPDCVYEIHSAASKLGIPKRQLITNGYFSKNASVIKSVCSNLKKCSVNDVLLSADAFHQETIPLETVKIFASYLLEYDVPVRLSPAWLSGREHNNPYNLRTKEIVDEMHSCGVPVSDGNIIFPEGNAIKYLSDYFDKNTKYVNPYAEDPRNIRTVCIDPDGSVLGGNIYTDDIITILNNYQNGENQ